MGAASEPDLGAAPVSTPSPTPGEHARATDALLTASRALIGISLRSLTASPVDITLAQHRLLVLLAARGGQTISALSGELGVDQSNASRLVDRLQRIGLIERRPCAWDRRAVEVALLPAGREVLDAVTVARRQEIAALVADLTPTERRAIARGVVAFNRVAGEVDDADWPS
nr:MarR family transcriptional regulator [Kineosporia rhizophila]